MTQRYNDLLDSLRRSYDANAADRDAMTKQNWKLTERDAFLDRLRAVEAETLLEIGAGPGVDATFFRGGGLTVTAVDLSPEMVALCQAKGIVAYARDFLDLGFAAGSFDAAHGLNCLLHVPNSDLDAVLRAVREVLKPGGLFFAGVYGGEDREGIAPDDTQEPKRFFSFRTDEQILAYARKVFEVVDFHPVDDGELHFQALTLAKPLD